jgi:hypothetical protein
MKALITVLVTFTLVACATMLGERKVTVTEAEIQQKLNAKLAAPISLLKVFDVNLSNSLVTFDKTSGRMHTTMDTRLSSALFNESATGKLGLSGQLRFDAATNSIVLDEPKIEQFNLEGASAKNNDLLNALAQLVGDELLNGLALYQVKPEDLKVGKTQYTPKDIVVTDQGLQLTFTPQ